ncbi:MAG: methyltransferase domain-containing protein [Clostridiales bacterium]|jgi:23S rRNA (guanine745-N1)-methyltransferase|nr:methyltransferase domain-containing protein [Clostridiales bacterium]
MAVFICPICFRPLCRRKESGGPPTGSFYCENNHCFDVSSKGAVNLLGRRGHGDSREMLRSRRAFLENGYYLPLAKALAAALAGNGGELLDAGCGEGYYSKYIDSDLGERFHISLVDVSADAAEMAAGRWLPNQRMNRIFCAAASVNALPFADNSFSAVMSVFAPLAAAEFSRVLIPGGLLIRVTPTARHLWGLKSEVYEKPYENDETRPPMPGFTHEKTERIEYNLTLSDKSDIRALFDMTPYSHKTSREDAKKLDSLESLSTEAGFDISCYRRI